MKTSIFQSGRNIYRDAPSVHNIELLQDTDSEGLFTVIYGQQVKSGLDYSQACAELGECILHDAACRGVLVNY